MSKRGRPCVIRMPKEDEDSGRRRQPWAQDAYTSRREAFEEEGFDVRGYDFGMADRAVNLNEDLSAQNCALFPEPQEQMYQHKIGKERGRFDVIIPDKRKWDAYMQQMMEDKLKALGVKPAGEEVSPGTENMSRQASSSFQGLSNSPPPLSSSVNSQHQWQSGMPFSPRPFSPTAFTTNTSVGALGSPAPSGTMLGRPGHLSRQSTLNLPFNMQGQNPTAQMNGMAQHPYASQDATTNLRFPSHSGTPVPSTYPRMASAMARASPDMFGTERSQSQTPRGHMVHFGGNGRPDLNRRGTMLSEQVLAASEMSLHNGRPTRNISTPPPAFRAQSNTELTYPTPRSHRHNISQNLEREAENAQYYPGEFVHEDQSRTGPHNKIGTSVRDEVSTSSRKDAGRQGHVSKASSSGFNVEAKEFQFEPGPTHRKSTSGSRNPFTPSSTTGNAAVSLLTAHANGETTGSGSFNVTAPAFKPPAQSDFNFSSSFDFSAKKPELKTEVQEGGKANDSPASKIFSGVSISEDIIKPAKKSKAIPIVNPNAAPLKSKEDAEPTEDEEGRIAQNRDRFKRSKPTMLDGQNEPKFDVPRSVDASIKVEIPTTLPKLDSKIDEQDSDFDEGEKEPWHDFGLGLPRERSQPEPSNQGKPAKAAYVPPHKRKNAVHDVEEDGPDPQIPAVAEASEILTNEAAIERQQTRSQSPECPPGSLSPTYQEIDAIMENLNGEPSFGVEEDQSDNKLPAPVKSPMKREPSNGDSPLLRESKLSAFQAAPPKRSPAVSPDWLLEQQQPMRASASPIRKLVGSKDAEVSDWDDMLESGDEAKLVPHAQFFDNRIKSLIEGLLQQHLSPLQRSLKDVDSTVRAVSATTPAPLRPSTDRTDSDADDEDNADETQPPRHARRPQPKLEQIRAVVLDAIKPLAMGNTALPDASEIRAMIADELKPLSDRTHALDANKVRSIMSEALASAEAAKEPLDIEQMKLVVAESIKAFGPPPAPEISQDQIRSLINQAVASTAPESPPLSLAQVRSIVTEAVQASTSTAAAFDDEQIRSLINQAVASSAPQHPPLNHAQVRSIVTDVVKTCTPTPAPTTEFDPENMKLVVAETIKAFGMASSSIDPGQMREIVTEAMKSSTPIADPFDPEHMKMVVAETVKAFGGPHEPLDFEKMRDTIYEVVKSSAPPPSPAFVSDEIRAIVKEVVNFSKAEDSTLEPEHIRSIIVEAIASAGVKEAIASSSDASKASGAADLQRLETEIRLRSDAESRSKDLEKMLELSEKEISLYKENTAQTDSHIHGLRRDKQVSQDRIEGLEKAGRELRTRMSGQANQVSALESTLDEYRKNAQRWREELESVKQGRESLQSVIENLRQEAKQHQKHTDELTSKAESLQEKLAGVARNFADEREAHLKKNEHIEALKEKLQFSTNSHNSDRDTYRRKDEESAKELTILSARLEEEMRVRQRLEGNLQTMAQHERNAIKASVQLDETRHSNARLTAEIQKLREEILAAHTELNLREREASEAKDIARAEMQRSKSLLEAEMEVAKRKFEGVRTELETRLHHVRQELESVRQDSEQQRKGFNRRAEEANHARTNAVRETMETVSLARNEERVRFDRHVADLSHEQDLAMRRALNDHQRIEVHFNEALKVKDEKLQLLEEKCKHLEDKATVAQSAAQAAATAAQQQQAAKARERETLRPSDRVSPQALRESIVVLQEQLQERETRIESLEFERAELAKAKEAETHLSARETEINWLRELLGVRVDDLSELVDLLSGDGYDRIEARDAAIRIRANLQMEQQEKEQLIGQTNKSAGLPPSAFSAAGRAQGLQEQGREMLRDVSNFATPRAAQIAAAWGNWRRGQASPSLSTIRDAVANPSATPSRHGTRSDSVSSDATTIGPSYKDVGRSASAAQTFLSGLMTPPASNYVRRTPTPTSTMRKGKDRDRVPSFSADGRELDAQPLSLSLEDELQDAGEEEISPQLSPTRSRPSKIRTPYATAGVSVSAKEDPLRTPLGPKMATLSGALETDRSSRAARSLEDELAGGSEGMGDSQEIAQDSVLSPLDPPENLVGSS